MNVFYSLAIFLSSFYFCSAYYRRWCPDGVEHPCNYNDWDCVSRVFAREMRCNRVRDIPDSRTINRLQLDYPSSNTSIVYHGATATGLSDFTINNFYINRKNNTLVMEVVFDLIDVESPNTDGYWYRKGKETIVTNGYCYTLYKSYSLTMTVRNLYSRSPRDINDITVFTYVSDAGAPLGYSKSFEPSDPTALAEYDVFFDNLGLSLQEEAVNQGPLFMSYVLPCDMKLSRFS